MKMRFRNVTIHNTRASYLLRLGCVALFAAVASSVAVAQGALEAPLNGAGDLLGSGWQVEGNLAAGPRTKTDIPAQRPFGTLREQAAMQQEWLRKRLDTFLPALMRKHGVDMWVVPMREYNEDPVFPAIVAPDTFAARRRTIYVFFDTCAATGAAATPQCVQRIALGGTSQGGVFDARRSTKPADSNVGRGLQAELWGDDQWQSLKTIIEERNPRVIGINRSTVFAFSDGLSSGELKGMTAALGDRWASRFRDAEDLPLELIAVRLPEEEVFFTRMQELVWSMTQEMFSSKTITPGTTRTSDLVWWWRQRVNDLGLSTWFQPSVEVQRKSATEAQLGDDPVIQRGDVLHCDVGITIARLNTDTQHMAYVLRTDENDAPDGVRKALANANALQDLTMEEIRPGRKGNEILAAALARMKARDITGSVYTHPIGLNGHGAGPVIGLWDYQNGVPGRGDAEVIPSMWFSIELQATTPVPEWEGQRVRMAQEEDAIVGADGKIRWALRRQDKLFLVK
jgi:Xaa-Pro aminopeptidase